MTEKLRARHPLHRTGSLAVTPAVVGHRGASGYRPEHTLESYRLAIAQGADDIELDLVVSADGVLLARHEPDLAFSTDVASRPALADRRSVRVIDGEPVESWFADQLTLAEIRTLGAVERFADVRPGSAEHDGAFGVPTLDEVLSLVARETAARGRTVGVRLEIKDAAYFASRGLPIEEPLLDSLARFGLDHARSRVTIMSFEPTILQRLAPLTRVPLVQLLDEPHLRPADLEAAGDPRTFADLGSPAGLALIERYADGVGPRHTWLVDEVVGPDGSAAVVPTDFVRHAHREWLTVHTWTLRPENRFLPAAFRRPDDAAGQGDLAGYAQRLLEYGVDALITDAPDVCLAARDADVQESLAG
ncbi:glycerophosphodiester phosphodiesterase family protein [Nocardioides bruguierae]|uniref:glycerophosphodiester phosphodiesterase n=1 Tax=Nocardioides bruguierae TaxID=2945102 RepID=A0A9X2D8C5_9ACTN|nr:glycerophosphodiester phosphodiesterase family protein [Nocardioides bruguierae]MCM0621221.1 glycerophosphodiester phosphodiesterase [Nocardioides bruguierae]